MSYVNFNDITMSVGRASYGGDSADVSGDLSSGVVNIYSTVGAFAALKSDGSVITWGGVEGLVAYNQWLTDGSLNLYYVRDDGLGDSKVGINMNYPMHSVDMSGTTRIGDHGTTDSIFYDFSGSNTFGRASEISGNARDNIRKVITTQYFTLVLYQSGVVYLYTSRDRTTLGELATIHGESDVIDIVTQEYDIDINYQLVVAIKRDGTVRAWTHGGATVDTIIDTLETAPYKFRSVSVGSTRNAINQIEIMCTAITYNSVYQTFGRIFSNAFPAEIGTNVQQVSAGENMVTYLRNDGTVFMELVYGGTNSYNTVGFASLRNIVKISSGQYHVVALDYSGVAYGWGASTLALDDNRVRGIGELSPYSNIYSRTGVWNVYAGGSHTVLLLRSGGGGGGDSTTVFACGETIYEDASGTIPIGVFNDVVRVFAGDRTTFMQRFEPNNKIDGATQFRDRVIIGSTEGALSHGIDHTMTLYDTRSAGSAGSIYIGGLGDTTAYSRVILADDLSFNAPYKSQWMLEHAKGGNADENHLRIVYVDGRRRVQPMTFDNDGNMRVGYQQDISGYTHRLDVCGNVNITGTLTTGNSVTIENNLVVRNTTLCVSGSQVSVGTRTPAFNTAFDVSGNARVGGNMTITGTTALQTITLANGYTIGSYFLVSSSGVGIGTVALQETLTVAGNSNVSGIAFAGRAGIGKAGSASMLTNTALDVSGNTVLSGRVGIGSGNVVPTGNALDVSGSMSVSGSSRFGGNMGVYGVSAGDVALDVSGTTVLRGGNVGIGKTNPAVRLDVVGASIFTGNTAIIGNVGIGTSTPSAALDIIGASRFTGTTSVLGNVGIGKTTPIAALDVDGAGIFSGSIGIGKTNPATALDVVGGASATGNVTVGGNMCVGKTTISPSLALDVSGNTNIVGTAFVSGATTICGTLFVTDISGFKGSQWGDSGNDVYYQKGFVGIGTSSPTTILEISGTTYFNKTNVLDPPTEKPISPNRWSDIIWAAEASGNTGLFVMVSSSSDVSNQIGVSVDGITWEYYPTPNNLYLTSIAWSPTANGTGLFVAAAPDAGVVTSPNGRDWTLYTTVVNSVTRSFVSVVWHQSREVFIGLSAYATRVRDLLAFSFDGITWTASNNSTVLSVRDFSSMIYNPMTGGLVISVLDYFGGYTPKLISITNSQISSFASQPTYIVLSGYSFVHQVYLSYSSRYGVIYANSGISEYTFYSSNGINWTSISSLASSYIYTITSTSDYDVALGNSGQSNTSRLSTQITNWDTTVTYPTFEYAWSQAAWSPSRKTLVAIDRTRTTSDKILVLTEITQPAITITETSIGIGIGTTPTTYLLDIVNNNTATYQPMRVGNHFGVTNTRIGIGTTNPQTLCQVRLASASAPSGTPGDIAAWDDTYMTIGSASATSGGSSGALGMGYNDSIGSVIASLAPGSTWKDLLYQGSQHRLFSNAVERLRVASSEVTVYTSMNVSSNTLFVNSSTGRVGIGKSNPDVSLDVNGSMIITGSVGIGKTSIQNGIAFDVSGNTVFRGTMNTAGTSGTLSFYANDMVSRHGYMSHSGASGVMEINNQQNGDMLFSTNNSEKMRIKNDGRVGIGRSNPSTTFDVSGTTISTTIGIGKTSVTSGTVLDVSGTTATTAIAVGKTSVASGFALDVSGSVNISGGFMTGAPISGLGGGVYPSMQYYRLTSARAGNTSTSAQSLLGFGVQLVGGFTYEFEGLYSLSRSTGSTSHTIAHSFVTSSSISSLGYYVNVTGGAALTVQTTLLGNSYLTTNASMVVTSGHTNLHVIIQVKGVVSMNTTGTFIPNYTLSVSPGTGTGAAYSTNIGSYFKIWPIGSNATSSSIGTWVAG